MPRVSARGRGAVAIGVESCPSRTQQAAVQGGSSYSVTNLLRKSSIQSSSDGSGWGVTLYSISASVRTGAYISRWLIAGANGGGGSCPVSQEIPTLPLRKTSRPTPVHRRRLRPTTCRWAVAWNGCCTLVPVFKPLTTRPAALCWMPAVAQPQSVASDLTLARAIGESRLSTPTELICNRPAKIESSASPAVFGQAAGVHPADCWSRTGSSVPHGLPPADR